MPFFLPGRQRRLMSLLISIYKTAGYCLDDCFASCENIVWISFKKFYKNIILILCGVLTLAGSIVLQLGSGIFNTNLPVKMTLALVCNIVSIAHLSILICSAGITNTVVSHICLYHYTVFEITTVDIRARIKIYKPNNT